MPVSGDAVITPLRSILQRKESTLTQRKRYIKKKIKRNTYFGFYLYLIIVLLSLFTVASYTWFTMSRVPQVNNMNVTIVSQQGLELSRTPGADTWYQQLNFLQMVPTVITNNQVLRPATWSDKNGCFYAATYGADGRHKGYKELNDGQNEYYIKTTYYARSGQSVDVKLQEIVSLNLSTDLSFNALTNIDLAGSFMMGVPGFSLEDVLEGHTGNADKAVRIGFRFTQVDKANNQLSARGPMIVYEPNCDVHAKEPKGYVPTPSVDGTATLVGSEYDDDGNPNPRLIRQTATTFGLDDPTNFDQVQINVGQFLYNPTLFHLDTGQIVKIEMYIWLEGQDIDCTNASVFALNDLKDLYDDQWLIGNIQFAGSTESQSGMVPIE